MTPGCARNGSGLPGNDRASRSPGAAFYRAAVGAPRATAVRVAGPPPARAAATGARRAAPEDRRTGFSAPPAAEPAGRVAGRAGAFAVAWPGFRRRPGFLRGHHLISSGAMIAKDTI